MACPDTVRLGRGDRRVRHRESGAFGVAESRGNGWVCVAWDSGIVADYFAPYTAGWLEVVS
jgi:hypothetical protein